MVSRNTTLENLFWSQNYKEALETIQDYLIKAVKITFSKHNQVICIYIAASGEFWTVLIIETNRKPDLDQQHALLAFQGETFAAAQRNWSSYEKETFAVVQSFGTMNYLPRDARQTHVHTEHKSLLYVFAPLAHRPKSPRQSTSKVHRLKIHLSQFGVVINHIKGLKTAFTC